MFLVKLNAMKQINIRIADDLNIVNKLTVKLDGIAIVLNYNAVLNRTAYYYRVYRIRSSSIF